MSLSNAIPIETRARTPSLLRRPFRRAGTIVLAALLLLPVFGVIFGAFGTTDGTWSHLVATVLPGYIKNTLSLLVIVAILTASMGTATAWLVAATDFPGRKLLEWLLVLPIAAPAYIIAYVYTDLLEFAGPVQTFLRDVTGWEAGDYWFPQIRTLPGAGIMLSLVLYPYVYLITRSAFLNHSRTRFSAARSLGASPWRAFWRVALPAARPAILGGVALALMETAADFGVADYFGVSTFSTGIFRTWYGLGDQVAALRLAGMLLLIMGALVLVERFSRPDGEASDIARDSLAQPMKLGPLFSALAIIGCALPVIFGFVIPVGALAVMTINHSDMSTLHGFLSSARNSFILSVLAALVATSVAVYLAYVQRGETRNQRKGVTALATRLSTLGYALPGTLLAVGLFLPVVALDKTIARTLGLSHLILTSSIFILIYAYTIRFLTVAYNTMEPSVAAIPHAMDEAARTLGVQTRGIVKRVHFPILRPALYSAALMVFIDTMRELPATLLLRPDNVETLATSIYRLAADERLIEAAPAALTLVVIGLAPVLLLNKVTKH
jgi:iron(III) transport system permease protein